MDGPKRRGRPPGSRNKIVPFNLPRGVEFEPLPEMTALATTTPVILSVRQSFGTTEEIPAEWPATWRLPMPNDSVEYGQNKVGIVSQVRFDLVRGIPVIYLR